MASPTPRPRARNREGPWYSDRMTDLSAFAITHRWPAQHPERLQLYSLPTPNGVKVSIMLEEVGLEYEPHLVDILKNESQTPEFLSLNPNGKIPAILDPDGPGGVPLGLFESGAILIYLAEKTGKLLPADAARRYETIAWGDVPDGRRRSDVRPARLLPQIRRPRLRGQAAARPLCGGEQAPAARARDAARRTRVDHGRRLHHRRCRDARLGAPT